MFIKVTQKAAAAAAAVIISLFSSSCTGSDVMHSETYYDMFDTFVTVIAYGVDGEEFDENCNEIKTELYELSRLYDIYREYDGINNLATVNKNAGKAPVTVDERIISLLEFSLEAYRLTDGEINIAMGSVLTLWHDAREKNTSDPGSAPPPDDAALRRAAEHTDINDIVIDRESMSVYLADPEMSLDVGAIAKGYAADAAAKLLKDKGVSDGYAVNLGGNVITLGKKSPESSEAWKVSIRSPYTEYTSQLVSVELIGASLVSSGTYERRFEYDGESYHHIIDRDTLFPSVHFDGVSVTGGSSALCDALSTALFCMSLDDGMALVDSIEGVEAVWIKDGNVTYSAGFPRE